MTDFRRVRNRAIFALAVLALIAVWLLRLAFRLTGAALVLILLAIAVVVALGWINSTMRRGS